MAIDYNVTLSCYLSGNSYLVMLLVYSYCSRLHGDCSLAGQSFFETLTNTFLGQVHCI